MYHANNWGDKYKLLGVFGPFGPRVWGVYVSWCLHWYCIYHANNWRDMCKLLVVCGPLLTPLNQGLFKDIALHFHLSLYLFIHCICEFVICICMTYNSKYDL